mmetsp:Transcript_23332/g.58022  ORF Transcript_23332/g.58022 Transcript_23332/m.58022 type:complete len:701 (+) Transcript_23332:113-2215(+)
MAQFSSVPDAAQAQAADVVKDMIAKGHHPDEQDAELNTALHWAAWFRLDALLKWLLEHGARPDSCNHQGETPVHWAAKNTNALALDLLTKRDRSLLSQRDLDGFTPFILCAQNDNSQLMEWLYFKGVSVEEQDNLGRTALHWASYRGNRKTVQWLLSRSASIVHRDHEGTTAVHWAALKNKFSITDMLIEVGGVHLLDIPDCQGSTPLALAQRQKNSYLVACFIKAQVFQFIFGRPNLTRNLYALLFICFMMWTIGIWTFIVAPGICALHPNAVVTWSVLVGLSLLLWAQNYRGDPGWMRPKSILPQSTLIGPDPERTFDAEQPVESQMVHRDSVKADLIEDRGDEEDLVRLEIEQNKYNYQRQLISEAKKRVEEDWSFPPSHALQAAAWSDQRQRPRRVSNTETGLGLRHAQLGEADKILRQREKEMGELIARTRVEKLLAEGGAEYLELLDRGDFKQVCCVCRSRRKMRSHHCKECGRCVDRHDHHCPWIDNCVGLGNQRSFFCFIFVLFVTILSFYYVVVVYYFFGVVFPGVTHSSFTDLFSSIWNGSMWPLVKPLLTVVTATFNLVWVVFVGLLVARHAAYMLVNLTTFEVLVKPVHVQQRFPKKRGSLWYLKGFGLMSSLRNCWNYWTLNMEDDAADFLQGSVQELGSGIACPGLDDVPEEEVVAGPMPVGSAYFLLSSSGVSQQPQSQQPQAHI